MAKFPVEISDSEGIIDGLNYVLSGPTGLGQNFAGFSTYQTGYLTGNSRAPFTQPSFRTLYVSPINLSTSEFLDSRTIKFTFASAQLSAPFSPGAGVTVSGVSNSVYNQQWSPIGVIECTTTYCTVRTDTEFSLPLPIIGGGGTISLSNNNQLESTDCNARVTVTGTTDKVFVSGQLEHKFSYSGTGDISIIVQINRYRGFTNTDPADTDYSFVFDGTIAEKTYDYTVSGVGSTTNTDTIFTTILDQATKYNNDPLTPWSAYYLYVIQIKFVSTTVNMTSCQFGLRSLSAQVVKQ